MLPLPKYVIKRDGSKANFEEEKISIAIWKAVSAVGGTDKSRSDSIAKDVVVKLNEKYGVDGVVSVEEVQDLVETSLIKGGHDKTAKAYILYRHQRELLRKTEDMVNNFELVSQYVSQEDWRVRENSNMAYSLQGMNFNIAGRVVSNYWLGRVYPKEIASAHKNADIHIHDLDCLAAYCVGWDLKQLLLEGFTGVRGKVASKPAKHLRSALGQIVNFFYTLQGEAAGAQAFSDFDTYLAPFIRYDNLDRKAVKQAIQEFIFNTAVPTRVGFQCMSEDTEILTPQGWASYSDLKEGELIKTFNIKTNKIEDKPIKHLFAREYKGKMFRLRNRIQDQLISPKHRIVRKDFNSTKYVLEEIESVKKLKSPFIIPIAGINSNKGINLSNEEIQLLAWVIAEGSSENSKNKHRQCGRITIYQSEKVNKNKYEEIISLLKGFAYNFSIKDSVPALGFSTKMIRLNADSSKNIHMCFGDKYDIKQIPKNLFSANQNQARLFLDTYLKADGFEDCKISTTDKKIVDGLQHMCVLAGYGCTVLVRKPTIGTKPIHVLRLIKHSQTYIQRIEEVDYSGTIWCPNTDNETVIARRSGKIFITGNTPFTNITMDLKVPSHIAHDPVIIGGKPMELTYADFQPEMDLLNEVFCEVMTEGDASGRIFTFPIPTYNITEDFDWDSPKHNGIWDMTAKYGIPYFSNYVNSDMKPEDARSMCLDGAEEIIVKINGHITRTTFSELIGSFGGEGWSENKQNIQALSLKEDFSLEWSNVKNFLKTRLTGLRQIRTEDGKFFKASLNHPVSVLTLNGVEEKCAKDLSVGDYLLSLKSADNCLNKEYQQIGELVFDEELAFFLGYFTADGNYLKKPHSSVLRGMQFTFNASTLENVDKIKLITKKLFGYTLKEKKDPRYNSHYAYFYNSKLSSLFHSVGFKKYGRVSDLLFNSSKHVIESFLEGFFAGDGYDKRFEIHINDLVLAKDLVLLYNLIGVSVSFRQNENSQTIYLHHKKSPSNSNGLTVNCLSEWVPGFVAKSTYLVPGLNKGRMVGLATLQKYSAQTEFSEKISSGSFYPVRVSEIVEFNNTQDFYDVELEKNHRFVHSLGTITHNCCRLRLDNRMLNKRGGGLFGANPLTGSIGVVTINMARIGYLTKSEEEYFEKLKNLMDLSKESLVIKRKTIEQLTDQGLYPYSKFYLRGIKEQTGGYWTNHFSTIGLLGMNESLINFMNKDITTKEGLAFSVKVLEFMRDRLQEYQTETGDIFNLEATPGEGTSRRFAWADKKQYPNIIVANEKQFNEHKAAPYYTNSTQLPVNKSLDLFDALDLQDQLQTKYTGGTVFHVFLGEKIPSRDATKNLVKKIAANYKMPYFSITPTFSVCPIHGYIEGEHEYCPICEKE